MPYHLTGLAMLLAAVRLRPVDLGIVAAYLIGITLFGLRFREKKTGATKDSSLRSYFLANNTIPWWAIALSIVSAETSTLTIISIPGVAFTGDFGFIQIVLGYMLGRLVVALLFLPRYFAGEMLTAYQLIDRRFGPTLHKVTAGLFLLTRAAAEGVRVFAVSIVVGIAIGTGDILSIAIISALTLLYTFEGGLAAVIWTDVVQMAIYLGGTAVAILTLGSRVPGGWSTIHTVASAAGKFHFLNFALNLATTYTFWAGVLGGTFLTMASHGTDQLMVQRMLAARNLRQSQVALLSSGVIVFIQFALFLLIGAGLYVFYGVASRSGIPAMTQLHHGLHAVANTASIHNLSPDRIFPTFIVREMPVGIAGLLVAAILAAAMSNLSAALNSLSSTTVVDFYMHLRPSATDKERNLIAKSSTILWALVLFAIAVYSLAVGGKGHVVEIGLSIASVAYGCLLGVFLLGTLTKFATQTGATLGMLCGFLLNLYLWQGVFPMHLGPVTIPHIAWTWYVFIGALVTFAVGSLFSLLFRKQSAQIAVSRASRLSLLLLFAFLPLLCPRSLRAAARGQTPTSAPDFAPISTLMNAAVANHRPPGAVVLIGHDGKVVFEQAYGVRKLAGEPGLDGQPSPAEPMTEDTIFDMASLSKCLSTATAIMQLYEQGKIASFDDPVQTYLPAFNPDHDPTRARVTLRMLLTHTSGEAPDVNLRDPWGLASPNKAEGIHRALTTPLKAAPGDHFEYSDINFILLGEIVETVSGQPLDVYAQQHIFQPLGMTDTRYLPIAKACGPHHIYGSAIAWAPAPRGRELFACPRGDWSTSLLPRIAPEAHDNEGNATTNPDFDRLLRGTVHDPTTRRMGGVAGHAGVFSTAHDVSLYAAALLEKLLYNTGPFPLKQATLQLMTSPQQPGHTAQDLADANAAQAAAFASGGKPAATGLAPHYPAIPHHDIHGLGWDIDTAFSKPRGMIFPIGSFGHTGFTGTSLWMDPASDTYVILLANAIHPRGNPPISNLRGQIATAAATALRLYPDLRPDTSQAVSSEAAGSELQPTLTGIDVLESTHFAALANVRKIGLLTNQTGVDSQGRRTIDILKAVPSTHLVTLFSPEHGIFGAQDTERLHAEIDPTTHLPVTSLYGPTDADKRPTHAELADLDAVVIDLQDVGVRFYTYETVMAYFLEAAAREQTEFHHNLQIMVLDRPDPLSGAPAQGPVSDPDLTSYIDYMPLPVRHGLTLGELARYIVGTKHLSANLTVIPMQHWRRSEFPDQTRSTPNGEWINPSPNLRSLTATILYPGLGFLDFTGISVGRGSSTPFELFGASWMDATRVSADLTARHIPGVAFTPSTTDIAEDGNRYPFHGQTIPVVRIAVADRRALDSPEFGVEVLAVLHRLYPDRLPLDKTLKLLGSHSTLAALQRGVDPRSIAASWAPSLDQFDAARASYLLYPQ